ncbi:DeoR/GlpR family DNA-binding transcription regulator [Ligilactobacillus sp. LYQ135]
MLAEERRQIILDMLKSNRIVKVQEICKRTHCSESSVRRDLQVLEERGLLERVHGGAKINYALQNEPDMFGKALQNPNAKEAIGRHAAMHINSEDVIFLDAGTTTLAMVDYLPQNKGITVVTNGILHASALAERHIQTILLGGQLKATTKAIVGINAIEQLSKLRFNKAFLGINGVHPLDGYTTPDPDEAAIKEFALQKSQHTFVLADSSKLNEVSFMQVAPLNAATLIIEPTSAKLLRSFTKQTTVEEVKR